LAPVSTIHESLIRDDDEAFVLRPSPTFASAHCLGADNLDLTKGGRSS
jgi:hypothetical protein